MKIQVLLLTLFPQCYYRDPNGYTKYIYPESLTKIIAPVSFLRNIPIIAGNSKDIEFHKIVTANRSHREGTAYNYKASDRIILSDLIEHPDMDDGVLSMLKYLKSKHFKEIMRTVPTLAHRYTSCVRPGKSIRDGSVEVKDDNLKNSLRYGDKTVYSHVICLSGDEEAITRINKERATAEYVPNEEMTKVISQYTSNMTLPAQICSIHPC